MKAIIPAAGLGTRFLPIAKAVPKEMLPLGDRPVIHHVVAEAAAAGFDEILIIISAGKESICRYFEPAPALEASLEAKGKSEALEAVRQASSLARISYVYQKEMRGLGDAVRHARPFVGSSPAFAVLLGDTVMKGSSPLPAMVAAWDRLSTPSVALEPCPPERVSRYGIAGGTQSSPDTFRLERLVEKPPCDQAPRLKDREGNPLAPHAFAARYLFTPEIFDFLDATPPGLGGEIQLTDAMDALRARAGFLGVTWPGQRLDIGNPDGLIEAALALRSDHS